MGAVPDLVTEKQVATTPALTSMLLRLQGDKDK